jgi:acyl-CoA synthetase (AMP-forming)/AMP-acid ligase II
MNRMNVPPGYPDLPWETIGDMLCHQFVESRNHEAIVDGATRLTYGQLGERVLEVAAALQSTGFKPGDIVVIWGPNCWQWVVNALACWWLGGIVVPISARNRGMEVLPILQTTGARYLFSSTHSNGSNLFQILLEYIKDRGLALAQAIPDLAYAVDFDGGIKSDFFMPWEQFIVLGSSARVARPAAVSGNDTCMVLFTSGTTGRAKGVMRGHRQVLLVRWLSSDSRGYTNQDRVLVIPPFSHVSGLNNGLLRCLLLGMTCIIVRRYDPAETVKLLIRESITAINGPPSLFTQLLLEERQSSGVLSKLRFASVGASHCPPSLVHELQKCGIGQLCSAYGLTEFEAASETSKTDSLETIANTVGKPTPGSSVKILSDSGEAVAVGGVGEIYLGGYGLMQGYFKEETLTQSVLDRDGYFATGDLGRFNEEGNLQILGRKKDMIIVHGLNVYPAEVENQLMQSGVLAQAAVIGRPNRLAGEECVAFMVPLNVADFDLKQLTGWARKNMATYKLPGKFVVLDQMPLNANGKTDKLALQRQLG